MSKKLEAVITCPVCLNKFPAILYRSIWIEYPENRDLIFNNLINLVECTSCKKNMMLPFAFLATNVKKNIAVWYEPNHDEAVDRDIRGYAETFGPECFYAKAPRITDYEEFKRTILKFENGELQGNPVGPAKLAPLLPTKGPVKTESILSRLLNAIGIK